MKAAPPSVGPSRRWSRLLAEELEPRLLGARVVLRRFDQVHEGHQGALQPVHKLAVGYPAARAKGLVGLGEREHVREHTLVVNVQQTGGCRINHSKDEMCDGIASVSLVTGALRAVVGPLLLPILP